jgi:hypothetical protein
MPRAARWTVLATLAVAVAVSVAAWVAPSAASARQHVWSVAPDSTVDGSPGTAPEPTASEPSTPEPTAPDSTPATSEPDTPTSQSQENDELVGAGNPDSDVDSTTAAIAVVGFVLLVALAAWWMVRRTDPDAEPMPRRHPETGPPSDLL